MKNLLAITTIILAFTFTVNAQDHKELPPAIDRAEMQTEMMKEKLELTNDQADKVKKVNIVAAHRVDKALLIIDKMTKFKTFRSIQMDKDKALKKILTKVQYKKYEKIKGELKKAIKAKRKEKKKNR
jgi:Spy/CpxP family protein refolding chaperone